MAEIIDFAENTAVAPSAFCMMPSARLILNLLEVCQKKGELGAILGSPGVGKTTCFRYHAKVQQSVTAPVILFTPAPVHEKPTKMIMAMAASLGLYQSRKDTGECFDQVCQCLSTGRLLIVDEVQRLDDRSLDVLRSIWDATGCGLVVAGNHEGLTSDGPRSVRRLRNAPFISRMTQRLDFDGLLMPEDLNAYCDHHRIQGAKARALLERHVNEMHGLRRVARLVVAAREKCGTDRAIELKHIEAAITLLGLDR